MFKKTEFDHIRSEIILLHRQNSTQSVILYIIQKMPASSPDLNPLDYFVCGYMLQQLGNKNIYNLERF